MGNLEYKLLVLNNHYVSTKLIGTRLFALEESTTFDRKTGISYDSSRWVNVTNWSTKQLYDWLGY